MDGYKTVGRIQVGTDNLYVVKKLFFPKFSDEIPYPVEFNFSDLPTADYEGEVVVHLRPLSTKGRLVVGFTARLQPDKLTLQYLPGENDSILSTIFDWTDKQKNQVSRELGRIYQEILGYDQTIESVRKVLLMASQDEDVSLKQRDSIEELLQDKSSPLPQNVIRFPTNFSFQDDPGAEVINLFR